MLREMELTCQSCGRKFKMPQFEIDEMWERNISSPVFCCTKCALRGWNPQAVWLARMRRAQNEDK